jgi:putative transposase
VHGRRRPESLYGATKMWAHLQREGIEVARCTVVSIRRLGNHRILLLGAGDIAGGGQ